MSTVGAGQYWLSDEEAELIAGLCEQFVDGAEALAGDIADDQSSLPTGGGLDVLLEVTQSVFKDQDRARRLTRMFRGSHQ